MVLTNSQILNFNSQDFILYTPVHSIHVIIYIHYMTQYAPWLQSGFILCFNVVLYFAFQSIDICVVAILEFSILTQCLEKKKSIYSIIYNTTRTKLTQNWGHILIYLITLINSSIMSQRCQLKIAFIFSSLYCIDFLKKKKYNLLIDNALMIKWTLW